MNLFGYGIVIICLLIGSYNFVVDIAFWISHKSVKQLSYNALNMNDTEYDLRYMLRAFPCAEISVFYTPETEWQAFTLSCDFSALIPTACLSYV